MRKQALSRVEDVALVRGGHDDDDQLAGTEGVADLPASGKARHPTEKRRAGGPARPWSWSEVSGFPALGITFPDWPRACTVLRR